MPDRRRHRGPHPEDARLFAPALQPVLRRAVGDLSWLLTGGYSRKSALKLVGDRYDLVARQRTAVGRCACSDADLARRKRHRVGREQLAGQPLWVDGYNVLTSIEAALSGGLILPGRDGTYRDMASMHGSYRKVEETLPALELLGRMIANLKVSLCVWYLDRPVSNSGRLKTVIQRMADAHDRPWRVELVQDPDALLLATDQVVASADSVILDGCRAWFNLAAETIDGHLPQARIIEMLP